MPYAVNFMSHDVQDRLKLVKQVPGAQPVFLDGFGSRYCLSCPPKKVMAASSLHGQKGAAGTMIDLSNALALKLSSAVARVAP